MFRKIVSNLPFSPALVGQLGFYARRLRKEETTRRAGLIVTALALVVQSFAVFSPPEAANASSSADFIPGGVSSKADLLAHYDKNTRNLKKILTSIGITRAELSKVSKKTIGEKGYYNWSQTSLYSYAQGQRSWDYGSGTVYYRPMTLTAGAATQHRVFAGFSDTFGWFAIKIDCGNLITKKPPQKPKPQVTCEQLTVKALSATRFRITGTASTEHGGKIKGYDFAVKGGGKTVTKSINTSNKSASFVYTNDKPGTYSAVVKVRSSEGLKESANCKDTFDIKTEAACTSLSVTPVANKRTSFTFEGKASASNGVTIQKYVYEIYNDHDKLIATKSFNSKEKAHSFIYSQESAGNYYAKLIVVTSIGEKQGANCKATFNVEEPPKPAAACANVKAELSNRNIVSLSGAATVANGAKITRYDFVVKNKDNKEVKKLSVTSDQLEVTAESFEVDTPGEYTVSLTVQTSLGPQTNTDNCVAKFKIPKPEVCPYNPTLPKNSPDCQPCPDNPDVWIKDEECAADIIKNKTASNLSLGNVDATTKTAEANNRISYTVTVENKGLLSEKVELRENLRDVLEYATVIDTGGGTFNKDSKTLTWNKVEVAPGTKQSRTFVVQVMKKIPLTNTGVSDEDSYDCKMVNTFGNSTEIAVDCPPQKEVVEQVVEELPTTGPGENMMFASILLAVVAYFYARSRQLGKEVRLIRKSAHAGTI